MAKLNINGSMRDVEVEADTPLLWVIREQVGLTGTKYGCGIAQCGACTVHINGQAVRSCVTPISAVDGAEIGRDSLHQPVYRQLRDGGVELGFLATGQIYRRSRLQQPARNHHADAAATAGDHGDLAVEPKHVSHGHQSPTSTT